MESNAQSTPSAAGVSQLHLDLKGDTLRQFIDRLAHATYTAHPDAPRGREAYRAVRDAVEKELRRVLVAYDTCGLGTLCHEAEPFDPWEHLDNTFKGA